MNKTKEYIKNDKVNYSEMTDFIQTDIFKIINNKLNDKYDYMKYRVSNNNNSSDAGSFHKDTKEGFTCCKLNTIFTCIMYWDKSMFQLIKGSHNILIMTPDELINYYKQKIRIYYIEVYFIKKYQIDVYYKFSILLKKRLWLLYKKYSSYSV